MLVLGVETATAQVGVALGSHDGVLASFHSSRDRRHAETLAPAISFVCEQAGVELTDVRVVAVDTGPGLFTGLRVGLATAKAVAHACGVPMIGIASLDLVAFPARFTDRRIVATVDARRGEVFHAGYRRTPGGVVRLDDFGVDSPDDVADRLSSLGEECLVVGDGAQRYAEVFEEVRGVEVGREGLRYPGAGTLVELAHARALREEFVPPAEIVPQYLRPPDAQVNWEQRVRA